MYGCAHAKSNSGMQVGCESRILDAHFICAHGKVSRPEKPLVIGVNRASLICFDFPQTDFDSGNSPAGSVADRSL